MKTTSHQCVFSVCRCLKQALCLHAQVAGGMDENFQPIAVEIIDKMKSFHQEYHTWQWVFGGGPGRGFQDKYKCPMVEVPDGTRAILLGSILQWIKPGTHTISDACLV